MNTKTVTMKASVITLVILSVLMCLTTGMATALNASVTSVMPTQQSSSSGLAEQNAPAQSAKVWTDKADYHPGESVAIYGSGFKLNTPVALTVTKLKDNTTTNWSAGSDAQGNLTTTYQIDAEGAPLYRIDATDGANNVTYSFTDAPTNSVAVSDGTTSVSSTSGTDTLTVHVGDVLTISGYANPTDDFSGHYSIDINGATTEVSRVYEFSYTVRSTLVVGNTYFVEMVDSLGFSANAHVHIKVEAAGPSKINQPITVTMANSAPSATVTINGGNPSPSTFSADGTQHTISIDSGASFTLSFSNSGNTRNGFSVSGSFSATSSNYTASTSAVSVTAYRMYQNTFTVVETSGTDSVTVTGKVCGANSTIVTLNSANSYSAQAWSDAGYGVTFPASTTYSGVNERYTKGADYTTNPINSGGEEYTVGYCHQYKVTFTASGGNILTDSNGTIVTVNDSPKTKADLPFSDWYDSLQSVSWAYNYSVAGPSSTYNWLSTSGLSQSWLSGTLTVSAGGTVTATYEHQIATHFTVTAPSMASAGTALDIVVTAKNSNDQTVTGYTGTIHFTSTDASAVLPADYTFTAADNGAHTFTNGVTLKTAGSKTVTVTDGAINGTSRLVSVLAASASQIAISVPASVTAGNVFSFNVTAQDTYGNVATGYRGKVSFTSSDTSASVVLPSDYTFTAADNGNHIFTNIAKLVTAGSKTISVTDGTLSKTSSNITVNGGSPTKLVFINVQSSVKAGVYTSSSPVSIAVQLQDQYGNPAAAPSTLTVNLLPSGTWTKFGGVFLPITSTTIYSGQTTSTVSDVLLFKSTVAGVTYLGATATGYTAANCSIIVTPGDLNRFTITGYPTSATQGQSFGSNNIIVTAYDSYNNLKTDYTGQVYFTSSDGSATLPYTSSSKYTFTAGDNGTHTFSGTGFTLNTLGNKTLTITDGSKQATSSNITVTPNISTISFASSGLTSAALGTILTVDGQDYNFSELQTLSFNWMPNSTHTVTAASLISVGASKQYVFSDWTNGNGLTGTSGTFTTPSSSTTVTVNYNSQYKVTFTASGDDILTNSSGTIVTVANSTKTYADLPFTTDWITNGSSITWAYSSPVTVSGGVYRWSSTSGLASGQSGTLTVTSNGTITGAYTYVARVNQPITVTMDNSAPSVTVTVTGGNPSPSTFTADGTQHTISLDLGANFTLSFSNSGNTRSGFNVGNIFSETSVSYTASTSAISITAYTQLQITLAALGLRATDSFNASGYQIGSATDFLITSPTLGLAVWTDYGQNITIPETSNLSNSTIHYATNSGPFLITTGGNKYTASFFVQYSRTFSVSGTSGSDSVTLNSTRFGMPCSIVTLNNDNGYSALAWVDAGSTVTFPAYSTCNSTDVRYTIGSDYTTPAINIGTGSISKAYTTQYKVTFTAGGGNILADSKGTIITVGGSPKTRANLPYTTWYNSSTPLTYAYSSPVSGPAGNNYVWTSTSGLAASQSSALLITTYGTVNATYSLNPTITFTTNGIANDTSGTVLTIDGTDYTYSQINAGLSFITWAPNSTHTITVTSPVATSNATKQYTLDTWTNGCGLTTTNGTFTTPTTETNVTANFFTQFKVTFQYTIVGGGNPPAITVYYHKDGHSYTLNASTDGLVSDWVDAGSTVQYDSRVGSETERWRTLSPGSYGKITVSQAIPGSTTLNPNYYHIYAVTPYYTVSDASALNLTDAVTFKLCGSNGTATPTLGSVGGETLWVDANSSIIYNSNIAGPSGERWQVNPTDVTTTVLASVNSSQTVTALYYHQYAYTLDYIVSGGGTPANAPILYGTQCGQAAYINNTLTAHGGSPASYWIDSGTIWTIGNHSGQSSLLDGSTSTEQWATNQAITGTASAPVTTTYTYYHQYMTIFNYATNDNNPITSGATIGSYIQYGNSTGHSIISNGTYNSTYGSAGQDWVDAGIAKVSYQSFTVNSGANTNAEHWVTTSPASFDVSSPSPVSYTAYIHQYKVTFQYTVNGGDPSAPTVTYTNRSSTATATAALGTSVTGWADAGTVIQYTNPLTDSGNTSRWQTNLPISGGKSTVDNAVVAVETLNPTYYNQYKATLSYTISGSSTGATAPTVSYIEFGTSAAANLTGADTDYWFDSNTTWNLTNPLTGSISTERWQTSTPDSGTVTGPIVYPYVYYHQYPITLYYTVSDNSNPNMTNTVSFTQFGVVAHATPTLGSSGATPVWMDEGVFGVRYSSPITSGAERWINNNADAGSTAVINSVSNQTSLTLQYYHQYSYQLAYTASGGAPTAAPTITATACNSTVTPSLATAPATYWFDAGQTWTVQTVGNTSERWQSPITTGTVSADSPTTIGGNLTFTYYHQYLVTFQYSDADASTIPAGTQIGTYTAFGSSNPINAGATYGATSPANAWVDAGAGKVVYTTANVESERWALYVQPFNYNVTSSDTYALSSYYHQIQYYINYQVVGGGSPSAPTLTATQWGNSSLYQPTLNTNANSSYWLDIGTTYSVNSLLTGSGPTEQWICNQTLSGTAATATAGSSITYTYTHQYKIDFNASANVIANGAGTILTIDQAAKTRADLPFSAWYNSGSTVSYAFTENVAAQTNPSRNIYVWSSTSGLSQTAASADFTVNGNGTINAIYTLHTATSIVVSGEYKNTAGTPFNVTVTVKDQNSNTLTGYTGTVHFFSNDRRAVLPSDYTFQASDRGTKTFSVTLVHAPNGYITVTDTEAGTVTGDKGFRVDHANVSQFIVSAPSSATAGAPFDLTVTAKDAYDNYAVRYNGTVHFTSNDTALTVNLPADYTFTAADESSHTFSGVTLTTAGYNSLTVSDTLNPIVNSTYVTVDAASLYTIVVGVSDAAVTAGQSNSFTALGYDQYSNPLGPQSVTYTVNGSLVVGNSAIETAQGNYVVSVNSTGVNITTANFQVNPDVLASIVVGVSSPTVTAGSNITLSATGYDQYSNNLGAQTVTYTINGTTVTGNAVNETAVGDYTASVTATGVNITTAAFHVNPEALAHITVTVSSSNVDAGQEVSLDAFGYDKYSNPLGSQAVTYTVNGTTIPGSSITETAVNDYTASVNATGVSITTASFHVNHAGLDHLTVNANNTSLIAGQSASFIVDGFDQYSNQWDITNAVSWNITSAAAGSWIGNIYTSEKNGTWTVTATLSGVSNMTEIFVDHAIIDHVVVSAIGRATITAGSSTKFIATAFDVYGNSWNDSSIVTWSIQAGADGSVTNGTASATKVGSWQITATIGAYNDTATLTVTAASLAQIVVHVSSSAVTAGTPVTFTAQGFDQYSNTLGVQNVIYTVNGNTVAGSGITQTAVGTYIVSVTTPGVSISASSFTVNAGSLARVVVGVSPSTTVAGGSVRFTAEGYDQYGNSLGPQAVTYAVNGNTVAGNSIVETAAGDYNVSVIGATVGVASARFHVNAGPLASLTVEVSPANATAGTPVALTAIGYDQYHNSLGAQTVVFTVNGSPIEGSTVTETSVGSYAVSVAGSSVPVTSASFNVTAASIDHLVLTSSGDSLVAGGNAKYTILAVDRFGNSWDISNIASYGLDCGSEGCSWAGNTVTVTKAGEWTVTASYGGVSVTTQLTVNHAALNGVTLTATQVAVGSTVSVTATAYDAYGNSWDVTPQTSFSIDSNAGGSWSGNVYTASKIGVWTITGTYGSTLATVSLTVNAGSIDHFDVVPAANNVRTGAAFSLTVTAKDAYGNTVTGFSGSLSLTASIGAVSPGTISFSAGVWTGTVTLSTTGSVTITVVDGSGHSGASSAITTTQGTYAITVNSDYGSPTPSTSVAAGSSFTASVTSPVTVGSGARMVCTGYSIDDGAVQPGTSYTFSMVQASHSIRFVWEKQYQVTVTAAEGGSVAPSGEYWVKEGKLAINALAEGNYTFSQWTSTESVQFDDANQSATNALIIKPCTLTANFFLSGTAPSNGYQSTTIIATETENQQTYSVNLNGNITASQMSNMTITPYVANSSTVVAFTVTGQSGTTGFANITLSKSAIPYGTKPVIYIDGSLAPNQGYTEDENNYYLWYTTHFSTHLITVQFETAPVQENNAVSPWLLVSISIALIAGIFVILLAAKRRKKDDDENKAIKH